MPNDLETWKAERKAALMARDGWLNLIARIDLPFGEHTIGAGAQNALVLPSGPVRLGTLLHDRDGARLRTPDGQTHPFAMASGGFPQLTALPFLLEVHDAGDQPALRVRDLDLPRNIALEYFPENPAWIIRAAWQALPAPEQISIGQKGGVDTDVTLTHRAVFEHQGAEVSLLATHWKSGKPMFVVRDATSGVETYGASRFLIGEDNGDGSITLDFNRAHNPPCAFSQFAICPLPPRSNVLAFAIDAGEKLPDFVPPV